MTPPQMMHVRHSYPQAHTHTLIEEDVGKLPHEFVIAKLQVENQARLLGVCCSVRGKCNRASGFAILLP